MKPPNAGPSKKPVWCAVVMKPCALPAISSGTASAASARPDDWIIAEPTPSRRRKSTSWKMLCERPQSSEDTEKTVKPRPKTFSRPQKSPIRPKMIESPMLASWNASSAHEMPSRSVPRSCATVGIDMLNILPAVPTKNVPSSAVPRSTRLTFAAAPAGARGGAAGRTLTAPPPGSAGRATRTR